MSLRNTEVTDAGCATLVAALDSGALPALEELELGRTAASAEAEAAVSEALAQARAGGVVPQLPQWLPRCLR